MAPKAGRDRLAHSAALAGTATLTSRVLGLARDQVLAALFGAGNEMDAFVVAFRIPNLVRDLFAEGAMSASFVPTFTRRLARDGRAGAWHLGNSVLNALLLATGATVVLMFVMARPLVGAYAGGFAAVPGKLELTVLLTRVVLPFLSMTAVAAAVMGMLNSLGYYFVPALSPSAFNVATIACALILPPFLPRIGLPAIAAIAIAALLGGIGQIAVQWPALRREGFRYQPVLDWRHSGLHEVLLLMGPGTIGLAATQINLLVGTLIATSLGTGAVSWLQYAFRLMYLPIGLFGVSIATALLPAVSHHAAVDDAPSIRGAVTRGLGLMLVVNVPATVALIVLAREIVRLLFEHGQFTAVDTVATAAALRCFAIGLVGYSATRIVSPVFYALGRSRIPIALSTASIALNVLLSVSLSGSLGFRGLAVATSVAALVNGAASFVVLRRQVGALDEGALAATLVKTAAASLLMAAAVQLTVQWMSAIAPGSGTIPQAGRLGVEIGTGLVALAAASKLFRIREVDEVLAGLFGRVQKLLRR